MKKRVYISILIIIFISVITTSVIFMSSDKINAAPYDERLTGVNWFGFETGNLVPHGLWTRDYKSMLTQISDLGFNCVRLPWCNTALTGTPLGIQINEYGVDPYTNELGLNMDLEGLSSIEVMDKIVMEAQNQGLYIILDNHSREPDGYMSETLWYTDNTPESKWISDWESIANRYKDYSNVVGYDLNNEPHGNMGTGMKPPATWGYDQEGYTNTDWKKASEKCGKALVNINPNALIIIEGTEMYKDSNYWWGGNLKGVKDYPITDIPKENLMYSPHEYGPEVYNQSWFSDSDFPNNMYSIWDDNFWFIHKENIAPILIGEFGITNENAENKDSISYEWLTTFMKYVGNDCSWTFWCINPNSGDTGGLLEDDWVTINQAKYDILSPYLANGSTPTPVETTTAEITNSETSTNSIEPTQTPEGNNIECSINYDVLNDWGSGATIEITITNNGESAINNWILTWTINNQEITNIWNANYDISDNTISVTGKDYVSTINPGTSVTFGLNITYSESNEIPDDFEINGVLCSIE
ncbi:MAG: cellulase family glycosylhydrolase [Clostridiales bacterium]